MRVGPWEVAREGAFGSKLCSCNCQAVVVGDARVSGNPSFLDSSARVRKGSSCFVDVSEYRAHVRVAWVGDRAYGCLVVDARADNFGPALCVEDRHVPGEKEV